MVKKLSLLQYLMKSGRFSKSHDCEVAIRKGEVTLNGKVVDNPKFFFSPKKYMVKFRDEKLKTMNKLYYMLNKPKGYICQKSEKEKTVYQLLPKLKLSKEEISSLFVVGRLDKDSEGLLIVTNDGQLSSRLSDPKFKIDKEYFVLLKNPIDHPTIQRIADGIKINLDGIPYTTKPCDIELRDKMCVVVTISEGKKRQVRRMFEAAGNKVVYLKRTAIGKLKLRNLNRGKFEKIGKDYIIKGHDRQN